MQEYPHGNKLEGRVENDKHKDERESLKEIIEHYNIFRNSCSQFNITDGNYLTQMIGHVDKYLHAFSNKKFDKIRNNGQSQIYSSILEEFMYHLFNPIIPAPLACGSSEVSIALHYKSYDKMISSKYYEDALCPETINADFVIGIPKESKIKSKKIIICPLIVIEIKRYADKNMRRAVDYTATSLKLFAPECLYLLVIDLSKRFFNKNYSPNRSLVKQTYIMRDDDNNLRYDMISRLFIDVNKHLQEIQKYISIEERCERGYMVGP